MQLCTPQAYIDPRNRITAMQSLQSNPGIFNNASNLSEAIQPTHREFNRQKKTGAEEKVFASIVERKDTMQTDALQNRTRTIRTATTNLETTPNSGGIYSPSILRYRRQYRLM